jgi:hypothetical protein
MRAIELSGAIPGVTAPWAVRNGDLDNKAGDHGGECQAPVATRRLAAGMPRRSSSRSWQCSRSHDDPLRSQLALGPRLATGGRGVAG